MSAAHDTGERILDAAAGLFATHGYAATTTRAIAEKAGVNEVTIFRRFESKLGVLRALGDRLARTQAGRAVASGPVEGGVRETLLALARLEIAGIAEDGALAMRLAFDAASVPEVREMIGEGVPENLTGLAEYLAEQQEAGEVRGDIDPEVLAEAFFGLTSSYMMYRMIMGVADPPVDIETDMGIEQLFDVFWSGASARKEQE